MPNTSSLDEEISELISWKLEERSRVVDGRQNPEEEQNISDAQT